MKKNLPFDDLLFICGKLLYKTDITRIHFLDRSFFKFIMCHLTKPNQIMSQGTDRQLWFSNLIKLNLTNK